MPRFYFPEVLFIVRMGDTLAGVLDELCTRADLLFMLVVVELLLLGLSLVGMTYTEVNSATFVVWTLNLLGLVVLILFSGGVLLLCHRRV